MVFSSNVFLFLFLPVVLAGYFLLPTIRFRNLFLLLASLFFYAWGEVHYVVVLIVSITANALFGVRIERAAGRRRRWLLWTAIGVNLLLLGYFKYADFVIVNVNAVLAWLGLAALDQREVHLPLGISFFTFQAISYIVDIHRRQAQAQRSVLNVALYISLFPQLIAGPIVRYGFIAEQLVERRTTLADFSAGVRRFTVGLAKKVLIANVVGEAADEIFSHDGGQLDPLLAWFGVLCYGLQIYFDFSGYSDMAIGLGRMFGFRFPENFRTPYAACSLREFWRRWHISLSTWFRDYVYIPLGGNRGGTLRVHCNLVIVFFLTGLWHGASWSFVVWGMLHGVFMVAERAGLEKLLARLPRPFRHLYLLLVVGITWVFFRAADIGSAFTYLAAMTGLDGREVDGYLLALLTPKLVLAVLAGVVFSVDWSTTRRGGRRLGAIDGLSPAIAVARDAGIAALMLATVVVVAGQSYNPFIYFRF